MNRKLLARSNASVIKLEGGKLAHYLPKSIIDNPNFPLSRDTQNVVELYDEYIIIRKVCEK